MRERTRTRKRQQPFLKRPSTPANCTHLCYTVKYLCLGMRWGIVFGRPAGSETASSSWSQSPVSQLAHNRCCYRGKRLHTITTRTCVIQRGDTLFVWRNWSQERCLASWNCDRWQLYWLQLQLLLWFNSISRTSHFTNDLFVKQEADCTFEEETFNRLGWTNILHVHGRNTLWYNDTGYDFGWGRGFHK